MSRSTPLMRAVTGTVVLQPWTITSSSFGTGIQFHVCCNFGSSSPVVTPSSALFYGALSVHAGIYLLLRSAPLFESTPIGASAVLVIGALTVLTSTLAGRVQSDVKSALAYATSSQVGLMAIVVGLATLTGSGALAMVVVAYMVAHAFLRTLQLLRAPSALRDAQEMAAALPDVRPGPRPVSYVLSDRTRAALYRLAHHRFFLDEMLDRFVVAPVIWLAKTADSLERRWVATLSGFPLSEQERPTPHTPEASLPRESREKVGHA